MAVETRSYRSRSLGSSRGAQARGDGASGLIAVSCLVLLTACASAGPYGPAVAPGRASTTAAPLKPGDAIQVSFSRESDQSGQYQVDEGGRVALPFLDEWTVRGVPPDSLRARLLAAYEAQLRNQTIDVRLLRRVRVLGAVQKPGLYLVDGTMTLADVVAKAGGATGEGNLNSVRVLREGAQVQTNLREGTLAFEQLHSGDQIYVPEKSWMSRHAATMIGATVSAAVGLIVILTR